MTGEARRGLWGGVRGGSREGWIVGACGAIQSSWLVLLAGGGEVFGLWSKAKSRSDGDAAERKRAKALEGERTDACWNAVLFRVKVIAIEETCGHAPWSQGGTPIRRILDGRQECS